MGWTSPNKRRNQATSLALQGVYDRLVALETAPILPVDLDPIRRELTKLRDEIELAYAKVALTDKDVENLQAQAKDFTFALSEGIERTDRAERRIKATVQRARKKLAEHGFEDTNLEAEGSELRERDGEGSEDGGVLPLHPTVAEPEQEASSIRGVSVETLRRARGW